WRTKQMFCGKVRRYLPAYHDGELNEMHRAEVERHLAVCHRCREELIRFAEGAQKIRSLVPLALEPPPPEQVWERISYRLLEKDLPAFRRRAVGAQEVLTSKQKLIGRQNFLLGIAGAVLGIVLLWFAVGIWRQYTLPNDQRPAAVQGGMRPGWGFAASRAVKWVVERVETPDGLVTVRVEDGPAPRVGSILVLSPNEQGGPTAACRAVVKQVVNRQAVCVVQPARGLSAVEVAKLVKPGWRAVPE
ncbi:MAG: zf-HC2 domain-containing protein, partial [Armatimonadota bacterium]